MVAGVLTAVVVAGGLLGADASAQPWFTDQASGQAGHAVLGVLAAFGEVVVAVPVLAVAALWRGWRQRSARPVVVCAVAAAATGASVALLKVAVGRTAPGAGVDAVLAGGRSYPSGHAATAAVCLLLAAWVVAGPGGGVRRGVLVTGAGVLSLAVGWATVALGFHWVSDVVGGLLVGAFFAAAATRWLAGDLRWGLRVDTVGATQPPGR